MKPIVFTVLALTLLAAGCWHEELEALVQAAHDHHACQTRQTALGECDPGFVRLEQADIAARAAGQEDDAIRAAHERGARRAGGSPETSPIGMLYRNVAGAVERALREGRFHPGETRQGQQLAALLDQICQGDGARDTRFCHLRSSKPDADSEAGRQLAQESRVVDEIIRQQTGPAFLPHDTRN